MVSTTAADVVKAAGATTDYAMALALQNYFLSDGFTYSTTAPVDEGYDGSSASVIATFLKKKAGYCVHFSSAMAVMARRSGVARALRATSHWAALNSPAEEGAGTAGVGACGAVSRVATLLDPFHA